MTVTRSMQRVLVIALACSELIAAGCGSPCGGSTGAAAGGSSSHGSAQAEIRCAAESTGSGEVVIRYEIRNAGPNTIHILDGKHMPYLLARDPHTLVILQGIHTPELGTIHEMPGIALTRPLEPAGVVTGEVVLPPKLLHDHYEIHPTPPSLQHGTVRVRCEVGWGTTAITTRDQMSIRQLVLDWQKVAGYGPVEVVLP